MSEQQIEVQSVSQEYAQRAANGTVGTPPAPAAPAPAPAAAPPPPGQQPAAQSAPQQVQQVPQPPAQQEPAQTPQLFDFRSVEGLEQLARQQPGIENDPAYQALLQQAKGAGQPPAQTQPPATPPAEGEPTQSPEAVPSLQSPFFGDIQVRQGNQAVMASPEDFFAAIQKDHSIDATAQGGLDTLYNTIRKWRQDSSAAGQHKATAEKLSQFLETLPPKLFEPIQAYSSGGDWETALQKQVTGLDYSKDWDSLGEADKRLAIETMFPKQFSPDDLQDLSDDTLKPTIQATQALYNSERTKRLEHANNIATKKAQFQQDFTTGIDASVNNLKGKFESFGDDQLSQVKSLLAQNGIQSLIYDERGLPRADAAEKVAYLLYGSQVVEDAKKFVTQQVAVQTAQQVANGQSTQPPQAPTGMPPQQQMSENMRQLLTLKSMIESPGSAFD